MVTPAVFPKKMAARRGRFSRKEVIEQVLVESVETEEDEGPEVSLNDILETSISNFTALRRSISNYTHFREEAHQLMRAIKAFNVGSTCVCQRDRFLFRNLRYFGSHFRNVSP